MSHKLEFYVFDTDLYCKDFVSPDYEVEPSCKELIEYLLFLIRENYQEAYSALRSCYIKSRPNKEIFYFRMVNRFLRCNFAVLDATTIDVDDGRMNFEKVECPIAKECKYHGVICSPKFTTKLSDHERDIAKMWYDGLTKLQIADSLCLSFDTINNHIRNIYYKLGVHEKADFVKYASDNRIFA